MATAATPLAGIYELDRAHSTVQFAVKHAGVSTFRASFSDVDARLVDGAVELKSVAVREDRQGLGIGRLLVERAAESCREEGATALVVATAAADTRVLRFYQLVGFRVHSVERDAFTTKQGYQAIEIDGIPLRDRIWLSRML